MLRLGAERDEVAVVADQRGCPTYVGHLAAATRELVDAGQPVRRLAPRGGRRLHLGRFRRGDLRGGRPRLPGAEDHDGGVRRPGPAPAALDPAQREGRSRASPLARGLATVWRCPEVTPSEHGEPPGELVTIRSCERPNHGRARGATTRMSVRYSFLTTWLLDAPVEPVWDAIYDTDAWPSWWPRRSARRGAGASRAGRRRRRLAVHVSERPCRTTSCSRCGPSGSSDHRLLEGSRLGRARRRRALALLRPTSGVTAVDLRVERRDDRPLDEPARPGGAAGLRLEPRSRHAGGR